MEAHVSSVNRLLQLAVTYTREFNTTFDSVIGPYPSPAPALARSSSSPDPGLSEWGGQFVCGWLCVHTHTHTHTRTARHSGAMAGQRQALTESSWGQRDVHRLRRGPEASHFSQQPGHSRGEALAGLRQTMTMQPNRLYAVIAALPGRFAEAASLKTLQASAAEAMSQLGVDTEQLVGLVSGGADVAQGSGNTTDGNANATDANSTDCQCTDASDAAAGGDGGDGAAGDAAGGDAAAGDAAAGDAAAGQDAAAAGDAGDGSGGGRRRRLQSAESAAGDGTLTFAPNVSLAAVTDDVKQAAAAVRAMAAAVNATQAILAPLTSPAITAPSSGSAATLPRTPAEVSVRARAALEELFMAVTAAGDALTGHSTLNKVPMYMFQSLFLLHSAHNNVSAHIHA